MFGLFFKEARETIRFATVINRSWVVKTKGQLLLGLAEKNPIAEMLLIMGSNPATVTEVIVRWYAYCQYNDYDRIVSGQGKRKMDFRHISIIYIYMCAHCLKIEMYIYLIPVKLIIKNKRKEPGMVMISFYVIKD